MTAHDTDNSTRVNVMAGALAGIAARMVTSPIDVVKIRLQTQFRDLRGHHALYTGPIDAFKRIYRVEGPRAFWKGNTAGLALYASYSAVQFSVYEAINEDDYNNLMRGSVAASIATIITYPFDLLRTRMSLRLEHNSARSSRPYGSMISGFRSIRNEGFNGFYKGALVSLMQVAPYMGTVFALQKQFSERLIASDFVSGGLAGITAKTLFMPLDVIRRRLQIQGSSVSLWSVLEIPKSSLEDKGRLIGRMWREGGLGIFYRGWTMAVLKSAPASAVSFAVFHFIKSNCENKQG